VTFTIDFRYQTVDVVKALSLGTKPGLPPEALAKGGATCRDRTDDLMITNQLLYQLS